MYGDNYSPQMGGDAYNMQMQNQNYGYNGGMEDPYYQQQQMAMMQLGANGYGYQGVLDANGYPMQPPSEMLDANGYPIQPQNEEGGYAYNGGDDGERRESGEMRRKKSFTGPTEDMKPLLKSRSSKANTSQRKGSSGDNLARNGSLFQIKGERETQRSVSTRGGFGTSSRSIGEEELTEYYGDMATRRGEQRFDGVKAVKSYRGEIKDGVDVGKPRRVTGARSLQGKGSTGYGGLNHKRECAMRNGENWGDIEVRRKSSSQGPTPKARGIGFNMNDADDNDDDEEARRRQMEEYMRRQREAELAALAAMQQQQMMMMAMMDQPAVPHVFNQEDVHSYSNLSDAFANAQDEEEDEGFYDDSRAQ